MRPLITAIFVCTSLSVYTVVHGQTDRSTPSVKSIPGSASVKMNTEGNAPAFVTFEPANAFKTSELETLKKHLFGTRPADSWKEIRSATDRLGMKHVRFQQYYHQLPVEGNVYIFHSDEGKIVSANGHFTPGIDIAVVPALLPEEALVIAAAGMKQPVAITDITMDSTTLLVTLVDEKPYLAYKCQVYCSQPFVNVAVYVDAQTGAVLKEISQSCSIDVPGTAHTQYSGTRTIITDSVSANEYRLRESGRGNGIATLSGFPGEPFSDTDNDWNNVNPSMDEFATDAHFGAEMTYDFFYNNFGLNSFDGNGSLMINKLNAIGSGASAYWNTFYTHEAVFGPGDEHHSPFTSMEIVGHEFAHGVTEFSAGLIYGGESGALNESFSDIFGVTIRFLNDSVTGTWFIGDQIVHPGAPVPPAMRNMANPNQFGCADTYQGVYWNSLDVVHFDSGVQNFWYYLLTEGGSGTNDLGNNYAVSGIGLESAMQIAYRNLMYYLTPSSTFEDARYGSEQAAVDLFGGCSDEHYQVAHAWYAVGVGPDITTAPAAAAFTSENNFGCAAPLSVTFHGEDAYLSYTWDFGDGAISDIQHPTHTYTNSGTYDVKLIVFNNDILCQQPDTIIIQNEVIIEQLDPVVGFEITSNQITGLPVMFFDTSMYGPFSWEWSFGDGNTSFLQHPEHIYADAGNYTVTLIVHNCHGTDTIVGFADVVDPLIMCQNTLTHKSQGQVFDSGGEFGNYGDNEECGLVIRPCHASAITLVFDSLDLDPMDRISVFDGTDNVGVMLAYITQNFIPDPVTATQGAMYILFQSDPGTNAGGFKAHYTSELNGFADQNSAYFITDFTDSLVLDTIIAGVGEYIPLFDQSTDDPYAWSWDYGDGTTGEGQQSYHIYTADGFYTITLTATFCDGYTDSYQVTAAIGTAGINELSGQNQLMIAPNPFADQFTISRGKILQQLSLRLLDMSGRSVYEQFDQTIPSEGMIISPGLLSSGQYLLEVRYVSENGVEGFERHRLLLQQ